MVLQDVTCNSCRVKIVNLSGAVQFACPKCGKSDIMRCPHCRKIGAAYACPQCSFTGP